MDKRQGCDALALLILVVAQALTPDPLSRRRRQERGVFPFQPFVILLSTRYQLVESDFCYRVSSKGSAVFNEVDSRENRKNRYNLRRLP
jgi:hypothetical protein